MPEEKRSFDNYDIRTVRTLGTIPNGRRRVLVTELEITNKVTDSVNKKIQFADQWQNQNGEWGFQKGKSMSFPI